MFFRHFSISKREQKHRACVCFSFCAWNGFVAVVFSRTRPHFLPMAFGLHTADSTRSGMPVTAQD
jgi:hypothetical protein